MQEKEIKKQRNKGGRPSDVISPMAYTVLLGEKERKAVAELQGNRSFSAFVRGAILSQYGPAGVIAEERWALMKTQDGLKQEIKTLEKQLGESKQRGGVITEEKEMKKDKISTSFQVYAGNDPHRRPSPSQCQNWLESRCKGTGISVTEMTIYLKE